MQTTISKIIAPGKGILAADESTGTIKKRFDSIQVESTEDNRRDYRQLLFSAQNIERHISGVILYDETIRQTSSEGVPMPQLLSDRGIVPGIKVDKGLAPLAPGSVEKVTQGLDGLADRLVDYRALGARFAKWRATYNITNLLPSRMAIEENAFGLARYAALCQQNNIVPIVEPEVLMDGVHNIDRCEEVTEWVLHEVFHQLHKQGVILEKMLLKPNMVLSGADCPQQANAEQVAQATIRVFRRTVPAAVPGILFLSGGQSDQQATENLNAINLIPGSPWSLSFSYGRALQAPALKSWGGKSGAVAAAQQALIKRAYLNGAATMGQYSAAMENQPAK